MDNNFMTIDQINRLNKLNELNEHSLILNQLAITYPQNNDNNNDNNNDTISENDVMMDNSDMVDQLTELFEALPSISNTSLMAIDQDINSNTIHNEQNEQSGSSNTDTNNYFYYTFSTCIGCIENQPNQLAHMGPHGCLEML